MDFNLLPNELLKEIISHLAIADAKNLSLTCKRMYSLSLERIWSKPVFKLEALTKNLDLEFLKKVSHLPIIEICPRYFKCSLKDISKTIPSLKCLNVEEWFLRRYNLEELDSVEIPMKLSTMAIKEDGKLSLFNQMLKLINSKELISLNINQSRQAFKASQLKLLSEKVQYF